MTTITTASATPRSHAQRARNRLRLVMTLTYITGIVGAVWDGWWHIMVPFDGFFSPPHLFVYGGALLAFGSALTMVYKASVSSSAQG